MALSTNQLMVYLAPESTGTNRPERFILQIPSGFDADSDPVPLLIAWHSYSRTPLEILAETKYAEEADARGWLFMCPEYFFQVNFGHPRGLHHVDASINHIHLADGALEGYSDWDHPSSPYEGGDLPPVEPPEIYSIPPIDYNRVYSVGFSSGGGAALAHAARTTRPNTALELGPMAGVRTAGVASLAGTLSMVDAWHNGGEDIQGLLENENLGFGGPPSELPFQYQQAGVADIDPSTYGTLKDTTLARNLLGAVPTYLAWGRDDLDHRFMVHREFEAWLLSMGWPNEGPGELEHGGHSWALVEESVVCAWLSQQTASTPLKATILADRGVQDYVPGALVRWGAMELYQTTTGAFSEISYNADATWRTITVGPSKNVDAYAVWAENHLKSPSAVLLDGVLWEDWEHFPEDGVVRIVNPNASPDSDQQFQIIG